MALLLTFIIVLFGRWAIKEREVLMKRELEKRGHLLARQISEQILAKEDSLETGFFKKWQRFEEVHKEIIALAILNPKGMSGQNQKTLEL